MMHFLQTAVSADVLRVIGVLGFLTYVTLYSCLSLRLIHSDSILYFCGNIFAASLVLISLAQEFNLAAALIQGFWIAMGIPAIALRLAHRRSDRRTDAAKRRAHPQPLDRSEIWERALSDRSRTRARQPVPRRAANEA